MTELAAPDVLGPGGSLAAAIPHYEDRPEQRAMSAAVARALADDRPLLVEAGTGTGKTLAYLVPALASGKRVVVSTGTRALQDQIARHDLPLLRTLIERPFVAVVLKGVANYLCRRRLDELRRAPGVRPPGLDALAAWADESPTGDRAEVDWLAEDAPVWAEITTTPDTRIGPRCPYFERCFVTGARRAADKADLILVNHHLYFADLALRAASPGARVLPDHDAVVFDEAHQLEDVATEHFGARVSSARLGQLVRDAHLAIAQVDLFAGRARGEGAVLAVDRAGAGLFARVREALLRLGADGGRVAVPPDLLGTSALQEAWFRLDAALEDLAHEAGDQADPPPPGAGEDEAAAAREQLMSLARRARGVRDDLAELAEQRSSRHVYWGEVRAGGAVLCASPIQVADLVRRHVVHGGPTAMFTSATLTVAGNFAFTRRRLGLAPDEVDELAVASPFDYERQAILYVPRDLPEPGAPAFGDAAAARITELVAITGGRAFCLFTSHRALRGAARRLADLPHPVLVQGSEPRASLIERFRTTAGAVLLGTGSFWQGVDVPGDALSLVVIDKLPFAPHLDPLVAARMRHVAEAGGEPFDEVQLPEAAIALKQGFGRLIRRRDDRGIVAILDPRMVTRTYGRVFVATLPPGLRRTSAIEQVRRWWRAPAPAPDAAAPVPP
jgi:ATP-dependent DNA helicase DinG